MFYILQRKPNSILYQAIDVRDCKLITEGFKSDCMAIAEELGYTYVNEYTTTAERL